ncbi:hypothetical protein TNCT_586941 [Trichonephila clavata]|uniref:Uncharacterized protein n=1 Tax=Trichonephila clavata TaxID=2740835 RepID=A0A8X6LGY5_TRICU|nr:hypothetical protein TNCT_586941 [Trichonephila clavata]
MNHNKETYFTVPHCWRIWVLESHTSLQEDLGKGCTDYKLGILKTCRISSTSPGTISNSVNMRTSPETAMMSQKRSM